MFLSSGFLAATAFSLSKAHVMFTNHRHMYSTGQYITYFLPIALHFGWVTAASLVNLNGAVSMNVNASEKLVAYTGHLSVLVASALGASVSLKLGDPVFGAVIAWALAAVADSMKQRITTSKKKDGKVTSGKGLYGAEMQRTLSVVGSIISATASVSAAFTLAFAPKNIKIFPAP